MKLSEKRRQKKLKTTGGKNKFSPVDLYFGGAEFKISGPIASLCSIESAATHEAGRILMTSLLGEAILLAVANHLFCRKGAVERLAGALTADKILAPERISSILTNIKPVGGRSLVETGAAIRQLLH